VEEGKTGLLVPPQDAPALARALASMLDNPEKTEAMGRASRKRAEELFDEEMMIDKICSVYEELLSQG
jgi:rhamnosyl/mannosyltransferase